ncbi:alanine racemase [Breznakia sp. PF5-3]|uniref:alanine racemase n=1 Tax=unclassified Breznakia TaxID=2623764 RepID=UPI002404B61B|nr:MULTISPECIES: alanine racemase [unclassified Breznakia]MDF9824155.1 alanine racemase [Breznakia sp. PM6-1]MDF9834953.1 alanine racemase [Breznakia sp. PF5-3]MDF9837178.1 alanine racemase [Breznakia sp. PFB2-8]MDF9859168.1 alanine racemase [Breznakia sp. PH5-24]
MIYRGTYSEIDLDNFKDNIETMQKHTRKKVFCVCKANAYSHGDYYIAKTAVENGCPYVCVSSFDEALSLRHQGFHSDILILGYIDHDCVAQVIEQDLTISVFSLSWIEKLETLKLDFEKLRVHIKVDTGMNRIGFKKVDEVQAALAKLLVLKIQVEGIYTHFHSADNKDKTACEIQMNWFYNIVDCLAHDFLWIHTANSDASLSVVDKRSNAVRVGLALYGIKSVDSKELLKPVLSLYSTITHIKEVKKGETISYGATYECYKDCIIATLPIGYGDGFIRKNQGRFVCIDTHPYEIVGRICMDQMMIMVDQMYPIGEKVEIIGEHIPLVKVAKELDMLSYEVLCLLNDRITKVIKENGKPIAVINNRMMK